MSQALSLYGIVGYGSTMLTEDNNQFDYNESFFDTDSAQSMAIKGIRTGIGFEAKISENVSLLGQWVISRENNKLMSYRVLSRKLTSLDRMTNTICNASIGARWTF